MRRYLLDTNICIFYMKGKFHLNEKIDDKMKRYCFISEITIAELLYGATCSNRKDKMLKEVESFISQFTVLPIYGSLLIDFEDNEKSCLLLAKNNLFNCFAKIC